MCMIGLKKKIQQSELHTHHDDDDVNDDLVFHFTFNIY